MAAEKNMDEFVECPFLSDPNELRKHETLASKNGAVLKQLFDQAFELQTDILDIREYERKVQEGVSRLRKLKPEVEILESKCMKAEETNSSLENQCQTLSSSLAEKHNLVPELAEESEQLKQTALTVKNDNIAEKKRYKELNDCLLLMKDFYKKNLGCHIRRVKTEDNAEFYLFTFESTQKHVDSDSMPFRSVKFQRINSGPATSHDPKYITWKLKATNPQLSNFEMISSKFEESQDTQGLLAYLKTLWKSKRLLS